MPKQEMIELSTFIDVRNPWFNLPTELLESMILTADGMLSSEYFPQEFKSHTQKMKNELIVELGNRN